jgi:hypothetical protein
MGAQDRGRRKSNRTQRCVQGQIVIGSCAVADVADPPTERVSIVLRAKEDYMIVLGLVLLIQVRRGVIGILQRQWAA